MTNGLHMAGPPGRATTNSISRAVNGFWRRAAELKMLQGSEVGMRASSVWSENVTWGILHMGLNAKFPAKVYPVRVNHRSMTSSEIYLQDLFTVESRLPAILALPDSAWPNRFQ